MARPNLQPILEKFVATIATRTMYSGAAIPQSVLKMIQVEMRQSGGGVTAPYWLGVLEHGRGKRRSTTDSGLVKKIYKWMAKRNMFKSKTAAGKMSEAKSMTWYINKYGNQQFRNKAFVDIYTRAREQAIIEINKEYDIVLHKITMDIL